MYCLPISDKERDDILPPITLQLTEREYGVIGMVTVQWGFFEAIFKEIYLRICDLVDSDQQGEMSRPHFQPILRAYYKLLNENRENIVGIENLIKFHSDTASVAQRRNEMIHSILDYDGSNPKNLRRVRQTKRGIREKRLSADDIYELYRDISVLCLVGLELNIDGKKISELPRNGVLMEDGVVQGAASREFYMAMIGQLPDDYKI